MNRMMRICDHHTSMYLQMRLQNLQNLKLRGLPEDWTILLCNRTKDIRSTLGKKMKMAYWEPGWWTRNSPHTPEGCIEVYQKCAEQRHKGYEHKNRYALVRNKTSFGCTIATGCSLHGRSLDTGTCGREELPSCSEFWCSTGATPANL